jgi:hypothetical protein
MARVELSVQAAAGADGDLRLRAKVRERGGQAVHLTAIAWEPLVPPADARRFGSPHGQIDAAALASAFGTSTLEPCGALDSQPIRLIEAHPGSGPLIVKLVGTDARGHRVSAWAQLEGRPPAADTDEQRPLAENLP